MPYSKWSLIELLGHRQHYGLVSEVTIAGAQMLRVEIPFADKRMQQIDDPNAPCGGIFESTVEVFEHTHMYAAGALYGLHELSEEQVRRALQPAPQWDRYLTGARPVHCDDCGRERTDCECNQDDETEPEQIP
jgi:hypothetical protein